MAATNTLREYEAFMRTRKRFLYCVGLWPIKQPSLFYQLLPVFIISMNISGACLTISFIVANSPKIPIMMKGFGTTITFLTTTFRTFFSMPRRKYVRVLHEDLDHFTNSIVKDSATINLISGRLPLVRKLVINLTCFVMLTAVTYLVPPVTNMINQYIHDTRPRTYRLVLPMKYPWSIVDGTASYYCAFIFESVNFFVSCMVAAAVDSHFMVYILQLSWELRAMSHQFSDLKDHDDYDLVVQDCIRSYKRLIRCRDNVEKIYGPIFLWMMVSSAVTMCACVFQLANIRALSFIQIFHIGMYLGARLSLLFGYTWSGTVLTTESEALRDTIYSSNWPGSGRQRYMTSILIMLTQKPLVISACSFAAISIKLFPKLINTAISYFFLLRTMEDKKK
uniref:Odorant receptor n=1 Tax=Meteorus pulchricornis TaxID=51522 RepID=A0A1S5VFQ3_9HYME|nr:olfactory receptor 73 [Meteorus pulchricornis]